MSNEKRRVLEMLEQGKITEQDAARLLDALGESGELPGTPPAQSLTLVPAADMESAAEEAARKAEQVESAAEEAARKAEQMESAAEMEGPRQEPKEGVPNLTLYPEGDDGLADEISRTVEDTIEQAQKKLGNDWNAIGERINEAVTGKMNAIFNGMPPTPPAPPAPPAPEAENLAELTEPGTPYQWNIGSGELNSLSIDWVSGQVEIAQGDSNKVVVTEYSKRPLNEDERMHITFEDGEMHIRWCEKRKTWGFHRNFLTVKSKKLVVELPGGQDGMEEVRVNTASASVSIAQIAACLDELEVTTASGSVSVSEAHGDDLRLHTASGSIKLENSRFDDASLKSASGSIWAEGVKADDFDAHSASGSVQTGSITADDFHAATASGSVSVENVTADDLTASTASGGLKVQNFTTDDANLKTVSGSLYASGMADDLHAETVSGGLELHLGGKADQVDLHTISGRIQLYLPETAGGFTANYSTTTGRFDSEFPFTGKIGGKNGCVVCGEGDMEITLSTMSGNMQIRKA